MTVRSGHSRPPRSLTELAGGRWAHGPKRSSKQWVRPECSSANGFATRPVGTAGGDVRHQQRSSRSSPARRHASIRRRQGRHRRHAHNPARAGREPTATITNAELLAPQRNSIAITSTAGRRLAARELPGPRRPPSRASPFAGSGQGSCAGTPLGSLRRPGRSCPITANIHLPPPRRQGLPGPLAWACGGSGCTLPPPELDHKLTLSTPYRSCARASRSGRPHPPQQRVEGPLSAKLS